MLSARLLAPVAAAIGLHATLLLGAGGQPAGGPGLRTDGAPPANQPQARSQALRVRWVAPTIAPATDSTAEPPATPTEPQPATRVAPAPSTETASVLSPLDDAQPAATALPGTAHAGPVSTDLGPPPGEDALGWLPRQALTQPPHALGPIVIDYPEGVRPATPVVRMKLALYIDERGHVRRTEPVGERLEAAFEHAANNAFLQARFAPGQLGPHAVRARITVEIAFEALPEQGAEARGVRVAITH
ncbi:hypothetical protein [uncultured Aquabacterium sp.]|jgi:hypothetical protein|uniref:hypothetical protein n=1 Tax=uncultured Aquabacterium sp. TaxID=158753 RepID=UPI0026308738|nr:hypothetical protein [uncultured Aquabacterium sp.]